MPEDYFNRLMEQLDSMDNGVSRAQARLYGAYIVPAAAPGPQWSPRSYDLVTLVNDSNDYHTLRAGEIGVVDYVQYDRMDIWVRRVAPMGGPVASHGEYIGVRVRDVTLTPPTTEGQACRCYNPEHGAMVHNYVEGECQTACLVADMGNPDLDWPNDGGVTESAFLRIYADDLAERDRRYAELVERASRLSVGQCYRIDSMRSRWSGYVARISDLPVGITVYVDIENEDGEPFSHCTLRVDDLGEQLASRYRLRRAPGFIRLNPNAQFSGPVTVSDRDVTMSNDDHDCTPECFDRGCTVRVASNTDDGDYVDRLRVLPTPGCTCDDCRPDDEDDDDYRDYDNDDGILMPFNHVPELKFTGEGPVFLGTELELSMGDGRDSSRKQRDAARALRDSRMGDLVFLKSDSSIDGVGFEAVFHPISYDYYVENWPEDLLRNMRNAGAIPHSSCGMHVHVSRAGFSDPSHAFKWIKFWYRNKTIMGAMARRNSSRWATFDSTTERAAAKWHAKGGFGANNRYTAINCIPSQTYEVRVFASTLNPTRFLGSLGLVDASVEYTRQLSTFDILKKDGWGFDGFREYAHSFRKYGPLQKEMKRILGS